MFTGFPPSALAFLRDLAEHNDRDWFQPRKAQFEEQVRQPMLALAADLQADLNSVAPAYATEPAKALYRIYRDTRFSPDKRPYKTHVAALFSHRDLGRNVGAALYVHLGPKEMLVAGGLYVADPATLRLVRAHMADRHEELRALLQGRDLRESLGELEGERTKRPPRGCPAGHPASDWLQRKQWMLSRSWPPEFALAKGAAGEAARHFRLLLPFVEFLNAPLLANRQLVARDPLRAGA